MKFKLFSKAYAACLAVVLFANGCGSGGGSTSSASFDQAVPEIKADWDKAVAADKANDYFTASINYAKLINQESKLTSKQFENALTASRELSQRMMAAAEKGDAEARAAQVKLMTSQQRR